MLPTSHVPIPFPEPLALLDATLLFLIQLLIAKHPAVLEEAASLRLAPAPRAARHVLDAIREVHYALDTYRAVLPDKLGYMSVPEDLDDDIPF
jgi:hypothetical protein